jgi:hypothetical protein
MVAQKATAGFHGLNFPKSAKPWQPNNLRTLTAISVTGKEFAKWVWRK